MQLSGQAAVESWGLAGGVKAMVSSNFWRVGCVHENGFWLTSGLCP